MSILKYLDTGGGIKNLPKMKEITFKKVRGQGSPGTHPHTPFNIKPAKG